MMASTSSSDGVSILHFEDQFIDMASIVHHLFLVVFSNVSSQDGNAVVRKDLVKNETGLRVYEFVTETRGRSFPLIRYVLTDSERMTDDLSPLLLQRRLFVLDAWRETDSGTKLRCNINETFQSIEGFYSEISDVVIFSAYPGNSERIKGRQIPMELHKSSPEELQVYLAQHVVGYLNQ